MRKYKISLGTCGKWALVSEPTGKAAIVFHTFERAADFVSRLPPSYRSQIDVTAVEALQEAAHGHAGDAVPKLTVALTDGDRITCPQCGAQYTCVVQADVSPHGVRRSFDDTNG